MELRVNRVAESDSVTHSVLANVSTQRHGSTSTILLGITLHWSIIILMPDAKLYLECDCVWLWGVGGQGGENQRSSTEFHCSKLNE